MKIFLKTTLALTTICILEANHPTFADSNFHLARGAHFGRGGEMRPIERGGEAARGYTGEGRGQNISSEPHTDEAPRVEDRVHTLSGDHAGEGVSDGGRLHRYDNGDLGAESCTDGKIVGPDGACVSGNTTTIPAPAGSNSGWTTIQ